MVASADAVRDLWGGIDGRVKASGVPTRALALLLGKTHVQEQPLRWGYLTPEREDTPHRRVRIAAKAAGRLGTADGKAAPEPFGAHPAGPRDASGRARTDGLSSGGRRDTVPSSAAEPARRSDKTVRTDERGGGQATAAATVAPTLTERRP